MYKYKGVDIMSNAWLDLTNDHSINIIHICAYKVNKEGKYPFQEFLMIQNPLSLINELSFPFIYLSEDLYLKEKTEDEMQNEISYQSSYILSNIINFDYMKGKVHIDGFYKYDKYLYVFIDMTEQFKSNIIGHFVLIDEIINRHKMNDTPIHIDVLSLFKINDTLCFLLNDETGESYEIPTTAYAFKPKNKVNFTSIFGQTVEQDGILGPYYYFTSYKNAQMKKPKNGGIVRFALFTGVTKYVENFPNDAIDESQTKKDRLSDKKLDNIYEKMTLRISDYDGLWAKEYDSIYLAELELDDGKLLKEAPLLVIKEHNQQIPLSIH
jgi:hypothetical protein